MKVLHFRRYTEENEVRFTTPELCPDAVGISRSSATFSREASIYDHRNKKMVCRISFCLQDIGGRPCIYTGIGGRPSVYQAGQGVYICSALLTWYATVLEVGVFQERSLFCRESLYGLR